ncbi:ATP-binding protein [Nocardioides cavernaquae]|uniref:LuxR family transcriptional regulator n=1 Tax=Nocardioides cavernaquae TaxID=2321396 RepID=A0A3A5HE37_9ACTN|nr:LuxR C-terminal-related transcriptional regulator [Nocardioides cavernaquae]RJS46167.1 LuxR family transcriptional regulator [Nocardioides cavernaquae]
MSTIEVIDLPAATPTSFVGRRHELAEARRLLGTTRVLTLVGTGGAGKTRLALRLSTEVRRAYHDGVCVVLLADLRDPALLELTVAERLQLRDQSGRDPLELVIAHLADRQLLLVLDNCEHLVEECGRFVERVTRACPQVQVLATSRQSLRVAGEVSMQVPPMDVHEASDLFSERGTAAKPSFALNDENAGPIARICKRLEGLPLAIELAAARIRVLSPAQIEQRLDARYRLLTQGNRDAPQRQQTLRALVDWSHDLCSPEEQLLWARASVFSGGFDLEAAEHVCAGDGIEEEDVLDLIDSLTDKSILIADELGGSMRYRMLETLREYGAERLDQQDARATARRHRDWLAQLAQTCRDTWEGPDQVALVARLHREHANLRVALDYCLSSPDEVAAGFRIATCLDDYWGMRGLHTEMRRWLAQALAIDTSPSAERAEALRMSGWYALLQGDPEQGLPAIVEAGETAAATGSRRASAYVTHAWGMAACFTGDLDQASTLMSQALGEFRAIRDVRGEFFTLFILGMSIGLRGRPGDADEGLAVLDECITAATSRGEEFWRAYALWSVAQIEVARDGLERADETAKQSLEIQRRLDNRLAIALGVDTLAWIAERQGRFPRAARLFGAADSLYESIGGSPQNFATVAGPHDRHLAATRDALDPAQFESEYAAGRALSLDEAQDFALDTDSAAPARDPDAPSPLTRREAEVAALVAAGLTNKDIATRLVISLRTAEGHVQNILVKLGLRSRGQIVAWHAHGTRPSPDGPHPSR